MKLTFLVVTLTTIVIFNCVQMPTAAKAIANENNQVVSSKDNVHVEAIKKAIKSYEDAFNSRDTKRLASHWSNEGVYTSQLTGDEIVGRDALEAEFSLLFAEAKESKLELTTKSIELVSPNVAVEHGQATVLKPNQAPVKSGYSVVYVKREGKWLIDRVSDDEDWSAAPTHYQQLKPLEWMIGDWVDQDGNGNTIKTNCKWTRNQNFIIRAFSATQAERLEITGMQFVGWDAHKNQIRSWVFDSDGGVAEGIWKLKGKNWIVNTTATLPDGKRASSTTILRPLDENSFGWQKTNRVVDGEILPNIDEVIIVRTSRE